MNESLAAQNQERKFLNGPTEWEWHLTFAGRYMQHNYYLYALIDRIMSENPDIRGIVEIGTGGGALTTVLGLYGISKNIPVLSVDHEDSHDSRIFRQLRIRYLQMDEFSDEFANELLDFLASINGPVLFICDGGHKAKEFRLWAPVLKPGSIIAVHDWTTELDLESINSVASIHCVPYKEERWNLMNAQLATFKVERRPFLSIVTRNHPDRQSLLERCVESVNNLRDKDFQHIVIKDTLGSGIPHANSLFYANKHYVTGEYVFVLDDDDILITNDLVDDMKLVAREQGYPDIIFIMMDLYSNLIPTPHVWSKDKMIPGHIGSSCVVVRNYLWQRNIANFKTTETPGDFNFIKSIFSNSHSVYWYGKTYSRSFYLNRGASERDIVVRESNENIDSSPL